MGVGKGFDAADSWNVALLFLIYAVLSVGIEHGVHRIKHLVHGKKTLIPRSRQKRKVIPRRNRNRNKTLFDETGQIH